MECVSRAGLAWYQFSGGHHDFSKQLVISLYHGVVTVAYRRRVRQCHAAAAALLWVMARREEGLLVILRRLPIRYAVTSGLICATKPSSPPRVTLTLYRPFRTILQKRDCLLHVRYRDGARDILAYLIRSFPNLWETKQALRARIASEVLSFPTAAVPSSMAPPTRLRHVP